MLNPSTADAGDDPAVAAASASRGAKASADSSS
jgi:hypothetical protein